MKKLILIVVISILPLFLHAQINDAEAKKLYQQAEETYNFMPEDPRAVGAYYQTLELSRQMKKWVPKTLYLNLKSAFTFFKFLDKAPLYNFSKARRSDLLRPNYQSFLLLDKRCDTLLTMVANQTYPAEKVADVKSMQSYFKEMASKYGYTKDRTPQDAVHFLNDCAKKFPSFLGNKVIEETFTLDNAVLKIMITYTYNFDHDKTILHQVAFVDLTRITGINMNSDAVWGNYYQLTGEEVSQKDERGNSWTGLAAYVQEENPANLNTNAETAFKEWPHYNIPIVQRNTNNFFHFNASAAEFQTGNYFERIKDAFQFLIDYFPKKKEEGGQKDSKF